MKSSSKSKGFSLIEILLVLGVVSIALAAIFVAYPAVRERNRVNLENQRILRIVGTIRNLYASKVSYDGLTTDAANLARAFAPEMNNGNNLAGQPIINGWEGAVFVNGEPAPGRNFSITYNDVPAKSCVMLATGILQNFKTIEIPAGNVVYERGSSSSTDVAAIVEACNADPTETTDIVFSTY